MFNKISKVFVESKVACSNMEISHFFFEFSSFPWSGLLIHYIEVQFYDKYPFYTETINKMLLQIVNFNELLFNELYLILFNCKIVLYAII